MNAFGDSPRDRSGDGKAARRGGSAKHDPATPRQEREAIRAGSEGTAVPMGRHASCVDPDRGGDASGPKQDLIREVPSESAGTLFSRADFGVVPQHPCPQHERMDPLPRYESSPRHVVEARYLGDYKVWLEFNDGRKGVVDLADELHGEHRWPLRNRELFSTFYLDYGIASIAWHDGVDFPPEFLYERLKEMH